MKLILSLLLAMLVNVAAAKQYVLINPNAPGSSSDITARVIADAYARQTGNKLVIESVSGGNHVPAVVRFKNMAKPGLILTSTSMLVFNPKTIKELPYKDDDFVPISPVGLTPQAWVVRADTPYKNMNDLVKALPNNSKNFVGYAVPAEIANLQLLSQHYKWDQKSVEAVKYRGPGDIILALMAKHIDVAIMSHSPVIEEYVKAGKFRILGNTTDQSLLIAGQAITSVRKRLGVGQVSGGILIASSPEMEPNEAKQLHQDILNVLKDPVVVESLVKRNQTNIGYGAQSYTKFIDQLRTSLQNIDL
jgi:tripartite-type tricarboxylate transporter receptor subunit TctC